MSVATRRGIVAAVEMQYPPYEAVIRSLAPDGYWRLGEASGNALDFSSNNRPLTWGSSVSRGATSLLVDDPNDKGATFPGGGTDLNAMLSMTTTAYSYGTGPFSFGCIIKLGAAPDATLRRIVNRGISGVAGNANWYMSLYNGGLSFVRTDSAGVNDTITYGLAGTWASGETHYILGTYDGTNMRLWLDGLVIGTVASSRAVTLGSGLFVIGNREDGARPFNGTIDEPFVCGFAVTQTQGSVSYSRAFNTRPKWSNIVNTDFTGTTSTLPSPWGKYGDFGAGSAEANSFANASYYLQANAFIENVDTGTDACVLLNQYASSGPARNGNFNGSAVNVSGAANNGSGLIRLTLSASHPATTGQQIVVASVGGTTEANGTWTVTRIDATHFDLQGSAFVHAYTSGGTFTRTPYPSGGLGAGWYSATIFANAGLGFPTNVIDHRTTFRLRVLKNTILGCHRNLPLYWGVNENNDYRLWGEEDFFEIDPVWAAPDGAGKELTRAFWHYSPDTVQWLAVDEGNAYRRIDLTQWHTYRLEKLNKRVSFYMDDMFNPLWSTQYGPGSGSGSSDPLMSTGKNPRFQQEQPNNGNVSTGPQSGTTGYERIEIDYITIDVPS